MERQRRSIFTADITKASFAKSVSHYNSAIKQTEAPIWVIDADSVRLYTDEGREKQFKKYL